MIGSTSYVLKRVVFPPTHLSTSTIYKEIIIYTSTIAPPSLFSILQWAGERTANKSDFSFSVKSNFSTHQYPCNPLYTFCTDPCFNNCLRPARERKVLSAQHKQEEDSAFVVPAGFTHLACRPGGTSLSRLSPYI